MNHLLFFLAGASIGLLTWYYHRKTFKRKLTALRDEEGYMAEARADGKGGFLLVENHCPICAAASACQGFCRSELEVFRKALGPGVRVEREEHLLSGARRCVYRIAAL